MTDPTTAEPISVADLRYWLELANHRPGQTWDSIVANLVLAYRDMAIRTGEWPCKCGHAHQGRLGHEFYFKCPCPEYRPEEL